MTERVRLASRRAPKDLARIARNITEAVDALYRSSAAPRSRERLLDLIEVQIAHAMWLGAQHVNEWPRAEVDE
jgi:hypothetical protein